MPVDDYEYGQVTEYKDETVKKRTREKSDSDGEGKYVGPRGSILGTDRNCVDDAMKRPESFRMRAEAMKGVNASEYIESNKPKRWVEDTVEGG